MSVDSVVETEPCLSFLWGVLWYSCYTTAGVFVIFVTNFWLGSCGVGTKRVKSAKKGSCCILCMYLGRNEWWLVKQMDKECKVLGWASLVYIDLDMTRLDLPLSKSNLGQGWQQALPDCFGDSDCIFMMPTSWRNVFSSFACHKCLVCLFSFFSFSSREASFPSKKKACRCFCRKSF